MWCLYNDHCLDIVMIIWSSINCPTVICLPSVCYFSREKPLVKSMAPGLFLIILHLYYLHRISFTILQSLLSNLYNKNTKNIYFTIFIRSHFCEWPWRDWQPLLSCWLQGSWLFVQVLGDLCIVSYWIDTFVLKLREILTLLCCITLSSSRGNQRMLKR